MYRNATQLIEDVSTQKQESQAKILLKWHCMKGQPYNMNAIEHNENISFWIADLMVQG